MYYFLLDSKYFVGFLNDGIWLCIRLNKKSKCTALQYFVRIVTC